MVITASTFHWKKLNRENMIYDDFCCGLYQTYMVSMQCFIHVYCKIMCLLKDSGLGHTVIAIFPLIVKSLQMNHIYWCESSLVGMAD